MYLGIFRAEQFLATREIFQINIFPFWKGYKLQLKKENLQAV